VDLSALSDLIQYINGSMIDHVGHRFKRTTKMNTKQLRKLGNDESFERSTVVDGDKVTLTRAVKPSEKSPERFVVEVTLDFSGVSPDDRLTMAANAAWITVQRRWRAAYAANPENACEASLWAAIDVQNEIVDAGRAHADPVTRAVKAIDRLDDAAREAVIQRYLADQKRARKAA
jgi:hypothetical protein